ncbi:MAG: metal ABC transporter substrate-binding protein [Magnetospirillum sp. WYHS-4]
MIRRILPALVILAALSLPAAAQPPRVVVSLPPLHSLVAKLLKGVAEPELLMPQRTAGRLADLSAAQVQALRAADLVVWSGPALEGAIAEARLVMPDLNARTLTLSTQLPVLTASQTGAPDRPGTAQDLRFWLDPRLAHVAVHVLAPALARVYPDSVDAILDNEIAVMHELHHLEDAVRSALGTTVGVPLHMGASDLRYLEWRFNLAQEGCARRGFDPSGFGLPAGPDLYDRLMTRARETLAACQRRDLASLTKAATP